MFRVAVVSAAVVLTLTRSACTGLLLGTRYPPSMDSLLDSQPSRHNIESDNSDVEREHSLLTGDHTVENTYSDVANAHSSGLWPFRRMEMPCMSFADKPPCKNFGAISLKHQRIDRSPVSILHGEAPVDKMKAPFLKNADKEKHRGSFFTRPKLGSLVTRTRDPVGRAGRRYEQRNDFDSGEIHSSKALPSSLATALNYHLRKRHAQYRHLSYESNEDVESREPATTLQKSKHRGFGGSGSKGDSLPVEIEDMYRENGYYIFKADQMTAEDRSAAKRHGSVTNHLMRHVPPVVTSSGTPSDDLSNSEGFRKFMKHAEKVVNAPIRQGCTIFASTKPTLAPAFGLQVSTMCACHVAKLDKV